MAWAGGPMRRQRVAFQRSLGPEREQDAGLAYLKENVAARFLAYDPQAQDGLVKRFRSLEVIDIDAGFDDRLNSQGNLPSTCAIPLQLF